MQSTNVPPDVTHLEEGVPVDVVEHVLNGEGPEGLGTNDGGLDGLVDGVSPVNHKGLGLCLGQGQVPAGSRRRQRQAAAAAGAYIERSLGTHIGRHQHTRSCCT